MMDPWRCVPVFLVLQGVLEVMVRGVDTTEYKASACYGTHHNFLEIDCTPTMRVEIVATRNGAKKLTNNCPLPTDENNYRDECCKYSEGDCIISSASAFPTECHDVSYCRPRATWVDTSKNCNGKVYPSQTHYLEITFRCVTGIRTTTTTTTTSTTTTPTTTSTTTTPTTTTTTTTTSPTSIIVDTPGVNHTSDVTGRTLSFEPSINWTTAFLKTTTPRAAQTGHASVSQNEPSSSDSFTPAMVGGMIAGIVGLMLTIFIFIFYWGRKRQIRTISSSKPPQSSIWDFLLANTMSVRAFRGYDNFSSAHTTASLSSEESGSPVIRKNVWLPNISVDSGRGETPVVTSDDNCSIVTIERVAANRL